MTTAQDVINVARSQVGYRETGNNITKYWAELEPGLQGSPWCAAFMSWVFKHAGRSLPAIDRNYGYISALDAINWAKANGYWDSSGHYAPGDLLLYGGGEHTGLCVSDDGTTIHVIEGNWGDSVQEFTRSHGVYVTGVLKASRLLTTTPTPKPTPKPPVSSRNIPMTKSVQNAVHVTADGAWGGITQSAGLAVIRCDLSSVKYLQTRVGTVADGFWGANSKAAWLLTIKRIQSAIGTSADGVWGPRSQFAWTAAVNNNYNKF
jgi:hypothetical protein